MPQECVCVCVGIFIYIRRLGPFLGVKNLEFQYFLFIFFFFWGGGGLGRGGFRNIIIFGGMKILWIHHCKTGLVLGVISIHFRFFLLKVKVQDGDIIWGSPKLQIFLGGLADIPDIFWG